MCARYGMRMDLKGTSGRSPGLTMSIRLSINKDPAHIELKKSFKDGHKAKAVAQKWKEPAK